MNNLFFNQVSVIGVGFLGASFAVAMRQKALCNNILGYGRHIENLEKAKIKGIINDYILDLQNLCKDSDLIVLATPVGVFLQIINEIKGVLKKGCIITDVGSIKGKLVYEIESAMPEKAFYIGSHPIAGGEKSGADNAKDDLFNNALCIITPTENSNSEALSILSDLWKSFGSRVELMNPYQHDEVYALISHLPHLTAYALVNTVGDINEHYMRFAGQGFKDTTRIAMSPPEIWRDISALNRDNLLKFTGVLRENLRKMEDFLRADDFTSLEKEFRRSQGLRERLK